MWRRKRQPTPVFLPGESQGQKEYTQKNWKEGQEIFYIKTHSNITHKSQRQKPPKCHVSLNERSWSWNERYCVSLTRGTDSGQGTADRENGGRQGLEGESQTSTGPRPVRNQAAWEEVGKGWNPSRLPKPVEKLVPGVKRLGTLG